MTINSSLKEKIKAENLLPTYSQLLITYKGRESGLNK